jgi:hypothetical protein
MSFEAPASTNRSQGALSFTVPSSGAVYSAGSSGISAFSEGTSGALPEVYANCRWPRDFVAELEYKWETCVTLKAKVDLVEEFYRLTFEITVEQLQEHFGDAVMIHCYVSESSSRQVKSIIDQFKKAQHHINHSNDKSCFDKRDGRLYISWPLPDGVPKDYKYPNPRYPKRGSLTFDQPEPKIPLNDSIAETSGDEAGSTTSRPAGPRETATFVPDGYDWHKDYEEAFTKGWDQCDRQSNKQTEALVDKNKQFEDLVEKYFRRTMFWYERYFNDTIRPIRYGPGDRDEQRKAILLLLKAYEALQHQKGQLATSSWQGVVDDDSDNERP